MKIQMVLCEIGKNRGVDLTARHAPFHQTYAGCFDGANATAIALHLGQCRLQPNRVWCGQACVLQSAHAPHPQSAHDAATAQTVMHGQLFYGLRQPPAAGGFAVGARDGAELERHRRLVVKGRCQRTSLGFEA